MREVLPPCLPHQGSDSSNSLRVWYCHGREYISIRILEQQSDTGFQSHRYSFSPPELITHPLTSKGNIADKQLKAKLLFVSTSAIIHQLLVQTIVQFNLSCSGTWD